MELPEADDDSNLISLETSSSLPVGDPISGISAYDASEFLQSVPRSSSSLIIATGATVDDDEVVVPHEDPVPMEADIDTLVSAAVPPPPLPLDDDSRADTLGESPLLELQRADDVNECETTLRSSLSSPACGQQSCGSPTLPAEVSPARSSSPPHVSPESLNDLPGPHGTESAAVKATNAASVNEEDSSPAAEFGSAAVIAHDVDIVVAKERASSPSERPEYVSSSPPPYSMAGELAFPVADDDVLVVQEQASAKMPGDIPSSPSPYTMTVEFAAPAVVADDDVEVIQERASSPCETPGYATSSPPRPPIPVYDSSSEGQLEGFDCHANDGSSSIQTPPASSPSPVAPKASEGDDEVLDAADLSSDAVEVTCQVETPSSPGALKLSSVGLEAVSAVLPLQEEQDKDDVSDEQQPAKRAKTNGTMYSGADAVAVVLGRTAEIVLVLAGMAQMRASRPPTSYEKELAATAYQNLGILVGWVAPNDLVAKESLEGMLHDFNLKRIAQQRLEDQALVEARTEAEAVANAKAEALARTKAEATARAKAEAEELEHRRQAALKAAAVAANGPIKGSFSSVGGPLSSSGQSAYRVSELVQSPSLPLAAAARASSQAQMVTQGQLPASKAAEIPQLETLSEKRMSVNGQFHTPVPQPVLGKPPKVRNRVRKEPPTLTLFTPEFLNLIQNQAPDPQKAQVTHRQLCLGVQQFIREHIPPLSQALQALPPTYISTPFPCQVCKLIANDTGSVLVCDSCDEVSHVKCVQPPPSKGATKGDWNCPKCLIVSQGGKYPAKYGPISRGSPNSVKLWPPHDTSEEGNPETTGDVPTGSVRGERALAVDGRQIGSGRPKVQGKASLEMDTRARAHPSNDELSTGNLGSSPHLIVHLVNEPSPRTGNPSHNSSYSFLKEDNLTPILSGESLASVVEETPSLQKPENRVASEDTTLLPGNLERTMSNQKSTLRPVETEEKSERGLEKMDSQSISMLVKDAEGARNSQGTPALTEQIETRTQAIESKEGDGDSGVILPGKQAEVPLPIVMEWVGGSIRKAEGKVYYQACSVGGIRFSVSDCALFRPETPDVPPYIARLQVLWEDIATGHKWVRVSWCYYPTDIPSAMGCPGTTAESEVYESNHCDNNLVGSIQGPCFVLPPLKFHEETQRRSALQKGGDLLDDLPPIFMSRWMYDAPKGVFRPLQE